MGEDLIDGYKSVCVSKQDTGLPYDLWIDSLGKDRGEAPEVKTMVDGKLISVRLLNDVSIPNGAFPYCLEVQEYIKAYLRVFLAHYNKLITDRQALMLLTTVEEADSELVRRTLREAGAI